MRIATVKDQQDIEVIWIGASTLVFFAAVVLSSHLRGARFLLLVGGVGVGGTLGVDEDAIVGVVPGSVLLLEGVTVAGPFPF